MNEEGDRPSPFLPALPALPTTGFLDRSSSPPASCSHRRFCQAGLNDDQVLSTEVWSDVATAVALDVRVNYRRGT